MLVTGGGGLVGGRLAALLAVRHEVVVGLRRSDGPRGMPSVGFDLLDPATHAEALEASRAQAVVNLAALADADACERDPVLAERSNVEAPARLARRCRRAGVRLVHASTDLVLPGDTPFLDERAPASPSLVYGRTKLAGEESVLAEGGVAVRVALVHGRGHGRRGTASETVAWALRAGRRVRLYTDQYRTPVDPESLAQAVDALLGGSQDGRFHLGGPERLSRYDMGRRVAALLGLDASLIDAVTQADAPQPAPRPADCSMSIDRARRELRYAPRPFDQGVREGRPAAA